MERFITQHGSGVLSLPSCCHCTFSPWLIQGGDHWPKSAAVLLCPEILFTGPVDDLAGHIDMADVCICPLFAGGGTRLKLLEYLAGKVAVSTKRCRDPDEVGFAG